MLSHPLSRLDFAGANSPHQSNTLAANLTRLRPLIFTKVKTKFLKACNSSMISLSGGATVAVNRMLFSDEDRENEKRKAKAARGMSPFDDDDDGDIRWNVFAQVFYQIHDKFPALFRTNDRVRNPLLPLSLMLTRKSRPSV